MSASRIHSTQHDGFAVHVEDVGEGEVVILLHSSGMSGAQWRRTAEPLLRDGFRTIVPDLLGSGRSTPWPEGLPFHFERDVEVVAGLIEKLEQPVHLVGHSYGGHIALGAARRVGPRVRSLALYDPVSFGVLDLEVDRDAFAEMSRLERSYGTAEAEHVEWLRAFVEYWGGQEAWSRLREPARAEMQRVGWIVHAGARSLIADRTALAVYRPLTAKTLLIMGETSPIAARRIVERLGTAIADARVERLLGAGHMGPLTHLDRYNQLITDHLAAARR